MSDLRRLRQVSSPLQVRLGPSGSAPRPPRRFVVGLFRGEAAILQKLWRHVSDYDGFVVAAVLLLLVRFVAVYVELLMKGRPIFTGRPMSS